MSQPLPWTADHTLTTDRVRGAVAHALPRHAVGDVVFLAEGWCNRAYEAAVDGVPWVFRLPKRAEVVAALLREVRVLDVVRSRVPGPVPRAQGPFESAAVPYAFTGYPRLPGTQLQHRPPDWEGAARAGDGLGRFLTALHDVPPSAYVGLGVPDERDGSGPGSVRERGRDALERVAATLPPALVRDVRRALATDVARSPESRAVHADLGDDHVLTDEDGGLTGIIDWADFAIAAPHGDFVGGTMAFGDAFLLPALAAYGRATDPDFRRRVLLSAISVMVRCIDWGRDAEDARWTEWNRDRLPDRVAELLRGPGSAP